MKKRFIKAVSGTMAAVMLLGTCVTPVSAKGFFFAKYGRRNLATEVYVKAYFTADKKTPYTKYGLKKDKYVKKVTIRLKEGDYNKKKSTKKSGEIVEIEKTNNPFKTACGSWKWTYK